MADKRSGFAVPFTHLNVERLVWFFVVQQYDVFSNIP